MVKNLSLKSDFVFGLIFSKKGNEGILKDFLEAVLDIKITKVEVVREAALEKISNTNRSGALDLKVTLDDSRVCDVEMQIRNLHNIEQRTLFYASKLISEQLSEGSAFGVIKPVIMINILDYSFINVPEYHSETVTVLKAHRKYEIIPDLTYHFIELPKYRKQNPDMNNKLDQWLAIIDGMNEELIEMAKKNNENIEKVSIELEHLTRRCRSKETCRVA